MAINDDLDLLINKRNAVSSENPDLTLLRQRSVDPIHKITASVLDKAKQKYETDYPDRSFFGGVLTKKPFQKLFPSRAENIKTEAVQHFPFTEEAKQRANNLSIRFYNPKGETGVGEEKATLRRRGQTIFDVANKLLPEKTASFLSSKLGFLNPSRIKIAKNLQNPEEIASHEILHELFDSTNMGMNAKDKIAGEKRGLQWLSDWEEIASKDKDIGPLLKGIDQNLQINKYQTEDPYSVATERFAFLGQEALKYGPQIIPKELRKYYEGVIDFSKLPNPIKKTPEYQDPEKAAFNAMYNAIPSSVGHALGEIVQNTLRTTVGGIGASIGEKFGGEGEIPTSKLGKAGEFLFGKDKTIRSLPRQITKTKEDLEKEYGVSPKASEFLAPPLVIGSVFMDLTGWGGEKMAVKELPEAVLRYFAKEKDAAKIAKPLIDLWKLPEDVAKPLAEDLAKTKTVDDVKNLLLGKTKGGVREAVPTALPGHFPSTRQEADELVKNTIRAVEARPSSTVTPESTITQEARKYKSAEEYVASQKPVYHGTNKKFPDFKEGSFFSTDKNFAKDYGSVGEEKYLDSKKTFDLTKKEDFNSIVGKNGIEDPYDGKVYKTFEEFKNSPSFGNDTWEITEPHLSKIKSLGYDTARVFEGGIENFAALDKNIIKNKSQLTDIYNKAVGETGDFGPVYRGLKFNDAVDTLLRSKGGEAKSVVKNPKIGDIGLVYGIPGEEGYGLAKIETKHRDAFENLEEILKNGDVLSESKNRAILTKGKYRAIVSRDWLGKKRDQWLLTAYGPEGDVRGVGIEPTTSVLSGQRSTDELTARDTSIAPQEPKSQVPEKTIQQLFEEEIKPIKVSKKEIKVPEELTDRMDQFNYLIDNLESQMKSHPGKELQRFVSKKEGTFLDLQNPDSASTEAGKRAIKDRNARVLEVAQEVFADTPFSKNFDDPDVIRAAIDEYKVMKESYEETQDAFKAFKKAYEGVVLEEKDKVALMKFAKKHGFVEQPLHVSDVNPPEMRGGIKSPELDFPNWKDKQVYRFNRETFERNIEDIAPPEDVKKVKEFIVDPIIQNESNRIDYLKEIAEKIVSKMKELGIKPRSKADEYVQKLGEDKVNLLEVEKELPDQASDVQSAISFYRKIYNEILAYWNSIRARFGYKPILPREDFFRHYREITESILNFGLIFKEPKELPTELAGITEFFNPGKPSTTAELRRTGHDTSYGAMAGIQNYLDSVTKQMFHIDSVQRVRALENYIREASKVGNINPDEKVTLPNFVTNLNDYGNFLAGKKGKLDRALESQIGRRIFSIATALQQRLSRNLVAANISSAFSNFINSFTILPSTTGKVSYIQGMLNAVRGPFKGEMAEIAPGIESKFIKNRFPAKSIAPSTGEKIVDKASFFFRLTDLFTARAAVSAKYYDNLKAGMDPEQAIKSADEFARKIVGDRSYGQSPNLFQNKSLSFLTAFQLEINNLYSSLKKDIPRQYGGDKKKIFSALVQFAIFSYLFNEAYEKVTGRRPAFDVTQFILTASGLNKEGEGLPVGARVKTAAQDVAGQIPFGNLIFEGGRIPISSALPNLPNLFQGKNVAGEIAKPLTGFLFPVGGGQLKKTYEGIKSFAKGEVKNTSGNVVSDVEKNPQNLIRMALFGKYANTQSIEAGKEADRVYQLMSAQDADRAKESRRVDKELETLKKLKKQSPEAVKAHIRELIKNEPKIAEKVSQAILDESKGLTTSDRLVKQLGVENGQRAKYIYGKLSGLSKDEKKKYIAELITKKILTEEVSKQVVDLIAKSQE